MKTKSPAKLRFNLRLLFYAALLFLVITAIPAVVSAQISNPAKTETAPPPPPPPPPVPGTMEGDAYVSVEVMPEFPGGDIALLRFIGSNTKYPKEAKDKGIMGRVIVRFKVTADGSVTDATVMKGVDPLLDEEALRVVNTVPKFTPGKHKGENVPVWYMVPLTFTLRKSEYEVTGNDTIYSYCATSPEYIGGNGAFKKFKTDNLKYPEKAKKLGLEGTVIVSFIIDKNGTVSYNRIERGVSPALDNEAIRVTKLMPAWKPATEKGRNVKFRYMTTFEYLLTPRVPEVPQEDAPFVVVEEMPMFPGGDVALLDFIKNNTKYPEKAKKNGIQGRVIVRFCVMSTGGVNQISVLRGVDPELDAEAIRVVSLLSNFKPGKQFGKPVNVWYMVPITFAIEGMPPAVVPEPKKPETFFYDQPPVFKGGEKKLYNYINKHINYPPSAKQSGKEGKVLLSFVINTSGKVERVQVIRRVDKELDAEAVRVVSSLPAWTPGKLAGKDVNVLYTINVSFTLKK